MNNLILLNFISINSQTDLIIILLCLLCDSLSWYFPINFMEGLHADVPKVISMSPANTEEDFRNLNKRIECYGKKVRNILYVMYLLKNRFLFYWCSVQAILFGIATWTFPDPGGREGGIVFNFSNFEVLWIKNWLQNIWKLHFKDMQGVGWGRGGGGVNEVGGSSKFQTIKGMGMCLILHEHDMFWDCMQDIIRFFSSNN